MMTTGTKMQRIEIKLATEDVGTKGTFSGYGAVFGNVDAYGDVIAKGAFKKTLREWEDDKGKVHKPDAVISVDDAVAQQLLHEGKARVPDEAPAETSKSS